MSSPAGRGESPLAGALADAFRLAPGIQSALLVDGEGVLIESASSGDFGLDPEELAVEAIAPIAPLGRLCLAGRLGGVQEWLVAGDRGTLVVRRIEGNELFAVFRAQEAEYLGRVRFAARCVAERIRHLV
jgi:predicted regulator of Ras-like GTPase activity (Roadblock/LC7/MglB family)